ncbi:MAG: hypothetical protein AABX54_04975 [Nanoarchaeota archaeon]
MKKGVYTKGQVSAFVIIGILIVIILIGVYTFKIKNDAEISNEFFSQQEIKPQLENIQSNILWCLDENSRKGLETIGIQGGYYHKPDKSFDLENEFVPYYYYQGNYLMPSHEKITSELKDFVEDKVNVCLNELIFDDFQLKHTKPEANVVINEDEVVFEFDSSVTIKRGGKRAIFETKDYPVKQVSALNDILSVAEYITNSHKIDSKMHCASCIVKIAEEKDVYVRNIPFSNDSVLIIIGENRTSDKPYLFNFLNKYTNKEISDDFILTGEYAEKSPESSGGV